MTAFAFILAGMTQIKFKSSKNQNDLNAAKKAVAALLKRRDLGFWQLTARDDVWQQSKNHAQKLRKKAKHLVVLGMGGSALGGKCLVECLATAKSRPVTFLANTDPTSFERVLLNKKMLAPGVHFIAVSKSGSTLELACMLDVLKQKLGKKLAQRLSVITEPAPNPLRLYAEKHKLELLDHPLDVGGRFSALTPVGLVPAAFSGVDIFALQKGAALALKNTLVVEQLTAQFADSFQRGEIVTAFWSYVDELKYFLPWLQQLWAESLGKTSNRSGERAIITSVPVAYEGTCDQHSVLQQLMDGLVSTSILFLRDKTKETSGPKLSGDTLPGYSYLKSRSLGSVFAAQSFSTEEALQKAGRTTMSLEISEHSAETLGELLMTFELVIGALGELLNINAFDQPGVELGKKITKTKLESARY